MKHTFLFLLMVMLLLVACSGGAAGAPTTAPAIQPTNETATPPAQEPTVTLANPASVNCTDQGGKLNIESRPDGAQFGVCYFMDNLQCEEWALFRGECPVGGVKVTGYATEAGRYCAITGGQYTVTEEGPNTEKGNCTLPDGSVCEAQAFYEGACDSAAKE